MPLSRRAFLGMMLGSVAASSGCSQVIDRATRPDLPDVLKPPGGATRHPIAHLLNRAAFGARPGQIEAVNKMGRERWLDEQLDYEDVDDNAIFWRMRRFDTLKMKPIDLLSFHDENDQDYVASELAQMTLVRAIISERQLYEVIVHFWNDHFSIYQLKNREVLILKTVDDREVIRPHALGKFYDLLKASAHSPSMLHYLDNTVNEASHPNENYAREIMELHTLGVDGGYTETDVQEVARCFTGWTMNKGKFSFNEDLHDNDPKTVLGEVIDRGGKRDAERVLDMLAHHPSTARYICKKLVRHFVADDPPQTLIDACVQTWEASDGNIQKVLKTLLTHPEFDSAPAKIKRPFEYMVSLLRALNADYDGTDGMLDRLERMGNRPFAWVTPDGYPDVAGAWSSSILNYWNLAMDAVEGRLDGVKLDVWDIAEHVDLENNPDKLLTFFGRLFLSRDLNEIEVTQLRTFLYSKNSSLKLQSRDEDHRQMTLTLGLLLASPAFVWK